MKIIYVGVIMDNSIEHEIFNNKGLKAKIKHKNGVEDLFENITEVHYLYPTLINDAKMIALESNILKTGWTYDINNIDSIDIDIQ